MRSAAQGFYTMFGPEEIGGGGLGPLASVYLNARLSNHCGPGRVLVHPVVIPSPFTNGLSPVLTHLDPGTSGTLPSGSRRAATRPSASA